jgi:predicted RNA-binding Zn-ribbon protein involved in translation (DUF1610 family)
VFDNVTLWFAKTDKDKIITINEINDINRHDKYFCPMCGSELIPKAIESKYITEHFAHIDASKCNNETMMHWWFKNKFLEQGDEFKIVTDKERSYVCKKVLIEQTYTVGDKTYKPDVTILTECGKIIYFEMDYSNKKKIQDYIDIWLELKNTVVEVDIKKLIMRENIPMFKALFYNGKCFNMKKNDIYYDTIGIFKEQKYAKGLNKLDKKKLEKLDWFWNDVLRYKKDEVDIDYMINVIDSIDYEDFDVVIEILNKIKCVNIFKYYLESKCNDFYLKTIEIAKEYLGDQYLNYIKQNIEYCSHFKRFTGEIQIKNPFENCYWAYEVLENRDTSISEWAKTKLQELIGLIKQDEFKKDLSVDVHPVIEWIDGLKERMDENKITHPIFSANYINSIVH